MYLKFSIVVCLFLLKVEARGLIILLTSRSKSGIIYIENEKERGTKMLVLNLVRETTDDCFRNFVDTQWKILCEDNVIICPIGEYITMSNINPTSEREFRNNDIFEIFSTMCSLIKDEVEAVWDEKTEILTFDNGWFFEFY